MRICFIRFSGHFNFGCWRDEMQAKAWLLEMGQKYQELSNNVVENLLHFGDLEEQFLKLATELRSDLFEYADNDTQKSLRKNPDNVTYLAMILHKDYINREENVTIDGFEIHDDFYGETLKRSFSKYIK